MAKTVKIDDELIDIVAREASVMSRSLAGQVRHWLRIGMTIERSSDFDQSHVAAALGGRIGPDALSCAEQESFVEGLFEAAREGTAEQDRFFTARRAEGLGVGLRDGVIVAQSDEVAPG
ncbi:TA system antitoxin ParD family protein [Qipengyuania marisflavi]|uniref:ParD-like family protein n=1 Tax=Qipengyuania marisflavi TaxID=2486356 RepID=A0A5S3P837_9SPHN|nr:hypothetical protein [Qipengyuania marisflavi]TMM48413.1 hypothetical protein FEV51_09075 [Qipengyuania marisflavi]